MEMERTYVNRIPLAYISFDTLDCKMRCEHVALKKIKTFSLIMLFNKFQEILNWKFTKKLPSNSKRWDTPKFGISMKNVNGRVLLFKEKCIVERVFIGSCCTVLELLVCVAHKRSISILFLESYRFFSSLCFWAEYFFWWGLVNNLFSANTSERRSNDGQTSKWSQFKVTKNIHYKANRACHWTHKSSNGEYDSHSILAETFYKEKRILLGRFDVVQP